MLPPLTVPGPESSPDVGAAFLLRRRPWVSFSHITRAFVSLPLQRVDNFPRGPFSSAWRIMSSSDVVLDAAPQFERGFSVLVKCLSFFLKTLLILSRDLQDDQSSGVIDFPPSRIVLPR